MKLLAVPTSILLGLSLVACGGSDDGGDDISLEPDAMSTIDGAPSPDAPTSATCTATASYGAATAADQQGFATQAAGQPPEDVSAGGFLNADATPDLLFFELYDGFTVFTNGITPGTYTLDAAEGDYATCGLCVLIYTDFTGTQGMPFTDTYIANGGSVTITSIEGQFQATASNLTFTHVDIAQDLTTTPNASGCTSSITSVSFDATIMVEAPMP